MSGNAPPYRRYGKTDCLARWRLSVVSPRDRADASTRPARDDRVHRCGGASPAACPINRAALLARFHASQDGRLLSGAAAFAAMWRATPLLRPLGLAARSPWVLARLERLYVTFLRVRPRLQRLLADR